jgi:hypothetical protein
LRAAFRGRRAPGVTVTAAEVAPTGIVTVGSVKNNRQKQWRINGEKRRRS